MFIRMLRNDFKRKKIATLAIYLFIVMAVTLSAAAANNMVSLARSMAALKAQAQPADLVQMHTGALDQDAIDRFTAKHQDKIALQETMRMLAVDGSMVQLPDGSTMAGTVQDLLFVVQNTQFDFILDLRNNKLEVAQGSLAVPVYLMQEYGLRVGDALTIRAGGVEQVFSISAYARDYQMNAPLTSSKRFVMHPDDFTRLAAVNGIQTEYLIEFKLRAGANTQALQTAYTDDGLPANGPMIPGSLFGLFNALSDAAVAAMLMLVSLLLMVIATLCIRLTFLAAMEEDLREIGVMKATGIPTSHIFKVYLTKYRTLAAGAGLVGYVLSFGMARLLGANMRLYLSQDAASGWLAVLSLTAPVLVYITLCWYTKRVLKRVGRISAVDALKAESITLGKPERNNLPLLDNRWLDTNTFMGVRDVVLRAKAYRLLFVIFVVFILIVMLPLHIHNTLLSPEMTSYMGIGRSDLRIDLRQTATIKEDALNLQAQLEKDAEVVRFAPYLTAAFQAQNPQGEWDYLNVEMGDYTLFPLKYLQGTAPHSPGQIALSHASASGDVLGKQVGDTIILKTGDAQQTLTISGIYQDITDGGKTAKAHVSLLRDDLPILWYVINIDLANDVSIQKKREAYQAAYPAAQVNDQAHFTGQTLGTLIGQMRSLVYFAAAMALSIASLITALFLRQLLSRDKARIAIMRSLGLTRKAVKWQYMAGVMLVLSTGILLGALVSEWLGGLLASLALSGMGAPSIRLVSIAWQTWGLVPAVMMLTVGVTVHFACKTSMTQDLSTAFRA